MDTEEKKTRAHNKNILKLELQMFPREVRDAFYDDKDDPLIVALKQRQDRIKVVLDRFSKKDPRKLQFVKLLYWERRSPEEVREYLGIALRTYQQIHKEILDEFAQRLGWAI